MTKVEIRLSWWELIVALALAPEPRCDLTEDFKFKCPCAWCMLERQKKVDT